MKAIKEYEGKCDYCKNKLYKRKSGYVCKNWHCAFYWKYGKVFYFARPSYRQQLKGAKYGKIKKSD